MKTNDNTALNAIALAEKWQKRANELLNHEEKLIQKQMLDLLNRPIDKVILTKLMDQSFRSGMSSRVADQINFILDTYGTPEFFSKKEKYLINLFRIFGKYFSSLTVPQIIKKMRADSSRMIISGEPEKLFPHLEQRKNEDVPMNINHLGEAVLGEEEAAFRLKTYLNDLRHPEIEYISVKISTLYSQISSLAFENTVNVIKDRLTVLFKAANKNEYVKKNGRRVKKFINLDMEEYRDLDITKEVFIQTLEQPEFQALPAGIVLQAYLPDSMNIQKDLTEWAKKRVASGGAPIKLRIVKGANMEMEMTEASINGWPLATFDNKNDVDACFKNMVEYGMEPDNIYAVNLGIASHNLFDLAYGFCTAKQHKVIKYMTFEMLEGMANHVQRAIQEISGKVLLYAPVASKDQFINAIAYLIRRMDENTGEENFLRYAPNLEVNSNEWNLLKDQFIKSCYNKNIVSSVPKRSQNRLNEKFFEINSSYYQNEFQNEPDTDWSLAPNRKWAEYIRDKWKIEKGQQAEEIPVVVAGKEIFANRETGSAVDVSQAFDNRNIGVASYAMANEEDIEKAVSIAKADPDKWRETTFDERHKILCKVALSLRRSRSDLIGASASGAGKTFSEIDPEVSEAIDFTEFYPHSAKLFSQLKNIKFSGKGVGLVISPWNFPIAIPCGGIVAALSAGNTVIFKPASDAVLPAWYLCQNFWSNGVSKNVLQFLPCEGAKAGKKLTNHKDVNFIILTGGTDTGLKILKQRPDIILAAETGGKNSTIVTSMSDRDMAIKNVLHSAFSHGGQKCSATSLLILEKDVYEDKNFRKQLADAAKSLNVGSVWDFKNKMGPLIYPPKPKLFNALTQLESGESWLLKPKNIGNNPNLWTPGIKLGVKPGSTTHMTEFFGPVLGLMCANNLEHAIQLANQTGYGLTAGLESLDDREKEFWKNRIKAGNLYINKGTTGAIVLRQPFGGMEKSAIGSGIKAGSLNYVSQFMDFEEQSFPLYGAIKKDYPILRLANIWQRKLNWGLFKGFEDDLQKLVKAIKSYLYNSEQEFFTQKDHFHLRGQDNYVRYLPVRNIIIRVHENDSLFEVFARIAAAKIAGCHILISLPPKLNNKATVFMETGYGKDFLKDTQILQQKDKELIKMMPRVQRIRYAFYDRVPEEVFAEASKTGFCIARRKVLMEGRIEMLHYFCEQTVCDNFHRYGNLGERGLNHT